MSNSASPTPSPKKSRIPKDIRSFVAQRAAAGMPLDLLAQLVGVGYQTVSAWCKKEVLVRDGDETLTACQLRKLNKKANTTKALLQNMEAKRAAHEAAAEAQTLRANGLKILMAKRMERLAALRKIASQQAEYRKHQENSLKTTTIEHAAKRLENAHSLVGQVRALNPTAMNLHQIAAELGVSVDAIFAAYKLTNQRFR